jgi:hypothetical protein
VIGFLWLGPALAILILNFRNHIIGSGLNCRSHCRIDPYSTSQVEQIERLDSTNRDVLGALQFVAKGLEVWFMYVAASFIYILAVHISLKDDRLPVSLLLVYAEFMDLLYLKDLAMRIRGFLKERTGAPDPPTIHSWVLYVFVLVAACLCVIANLMGVATATLVIPGLQYIDINMHDSTAFNQLLSADPPTGDFIRDCTPGNLSSGQYSCTSNLYASSLDQLILSAVSTERHQAAYGAFTLPAVSQEDELSLSANVSDNIGILWAQSGRSPASSQLTSKTFTKQPGAAMVLSRITPFTPTRGVSINRSSRSCSGQALPLACLEIAGHTRGLESFDWRMTEVFVATGICSLLRTQL